MQAHLREAPWSSNPAALPYCDGPAAASPPTVAAGRQGQRAGAIAPAPPSPKLAMDQYRAMHQALTQRSFPSAGTKYAEARSSARSSAQSSSAGEADWDVVGDDDPDAQAVVHMPADPTAVAMLTPEEYSARLQQRSMKRQSDRNKFDRVPMFDTGDPQFTYGDGGGPPPSSDARYAEVMALASVTPSDYSTVRSLTWLKLHVPIRAIKSARAVGCARSSLHLVCLYSLDRRNLLRKLHTRHAGK